MDNFKAKQIHINDEDVWEDVIELAFVLEDDSYISIARIPYEDDVYIEFGEQINYCKSTSAAYSISGKNISFEVSCVKSSSSMQRDFQIVIEDSVEIPSNIDDILSMLFKGLRGE
jgi:hypothetical protein